MVDAATTPRVTPTASMSVRVPWGDMLEQIIEHSEPIVKATAEGLAALTLRSVPMGAMISMFIGPKIIDQYVDMGLEALKGVVHEKELAVDGSNVIVATVANLIVKNEPAFANWVGSELEPMIKAGLAKIGLSV